MAQVAKVANEMPADPARMTLYLPAGDEMTEGLENVGPGKEVTVTLKGKVASYNNMEYEPGARLEVEPSSVKLTTGDEEITLNDAIEQAEDKV